MARDVKRGSACTSQQAEHCGDPPDAALAHGRWSRQCLDAQQLQLIEFIDKIMKTPVSTQRRTPVIQTLSEILHLLCTDKKIDDFVEQD